MILPFFIGSKFGSFVVDWVGNAMELLLNKRKMKGHVGSTLALFGLALTLHRYEDF
jgi:hypothetical protein